MIVTNNNTRCNIRYRACLSLYCSARQSGKTFGWLVLLYTQVILLGMTLYCLVNWHRYSEDLVLFLDCLNVEVEEMKNSPKRLKIFVTSTQRNLPESMNPIIPLNLV